MAMNDPLGDMLTRIRNAQMRAKERVVDAGLELPRARPRRAEERRLHPRLLDHRAQGRPHRVRDRAKYFDGEPVIREIARVSKPGRRVYASVKELPRVNNGLGVAILSTPKGVMADHDAREQNVGGEILCTVF